MLYDIISHTEESRSYQNSTQLEQQEHYQISKLEESILRIRQESDVLNSRNISFTNSAINSYQNINSHLVPAEPSSPDQEDTPVDTYSFLSQEDLLVMDEFDKSNFNQV